MSHKIRAVLGLTMLAAGNFLSGLLIANGSEAWVLSLAGALAGTWVLADNTRPLSDA